MLVIGSFTDTNKMLIVDGQQRLTTMTIFFSCLFNIYLEQKKKELSDISWSYLSFKDDIGNIIMIEKNINEKMSGIDYDKKLRFYKESEQAFVNDFLEKYTLDVWDEQNIKKRAIDMAKIFYYKIIKEDEVPN